MSTPQAALVEALTDALARPGDTALFAIWEEAGHISPEFNELVRLKAARSVVGAVLRATIKWAEVDAARRAALAQAGAEPELQAPVAVAGWQWVPSKATEAMMEAGEQAFCRTARPGATWAEHTGNIWAAMLEAAPTRTPDAGAAAAQFTPVPGAVWGLYGEEGVSLIQRGTEDDQIARKGGERLYRLAASPPPAAPAAVPLTDEQIMARLATAWCRQFGCDSNRVRLEARLVADLQFDSIDCVDALMAAEDEFDLVIDDDDAAQCVTVADCVALVQRLLSTPASAGFDA